jgi:hypothetical protein
LTGTHRAYDMGGTVRTPLQSGVRLGAVHSILTVRVDESSIHEALESAGLLVLRVRHPLPACQRILVTRPIAVVVGPTLRAVDREDLARAAAHVKARLIEIAMVGEDRLVSVLQRVIQAAVIERSVLPELA